ncbi:hypothetical protein [Myxococcus stipitatus]|uniref:hypothetical protein n=1 Tax=Myxococcus stipitatus TaxID=83455 RepID=UPI0003154D45|nr:hypothetical protein [Myxococcus stipitatus]
MNAHRKAPSARETHETTPGALGEVADDGRGGNEASGQTGLAPPTHDPEPQV